MSNVTTQKEVEIKAWVREPARVTAILEEKGTRVKKYLKDDTYFAKNGNTTLDALLRLRKEKGSRVFTVKKREIVNGTEINEEKEVAVSAKDAKKILSFLTAVLGWKEYVRKVKKGRAYRYDGVLAEVSEVKGLGHFIELEMINPEGTADAQALRLRGLLATLGIAEEDIETRPYVTLLTERASR